MLTRGTNLNDTIDVATNLKKLEETAKMKRFKTSSQLFKTIRNSLTTVRNQFNQHRWYYVTREIEKFNKNKKQDTFQPNDQVLYYVGERQYPMRKIRSRFTGPFTITARVNHNTVKIYNEQTNETITCHTQKLKKFHPTKFTIEQTYLRQLKQQQKLNNEYRRKHGHRRTKL